MSKNFYLGIGVALLGAFLTFNSLTADSSDTTKAQKSSTIDTKKQRAQAYDRLAQTIATIESYYVDDVPIDTLINKAIDGLIANLDAHSEYLNEKKYKELKTQTEGEFGGLGITVGLKNGALTIIAPLDGTPAQKAGLKSGDVILKIEDKSTLGMSIDEAVNLMRGKPKTTITLSIVRKGEGKPLIFTITRDIIKVQSVHVKPIDDTPYLYVRVNSFDKNVAQSVQQALKTHKSTQGIVLDLRNNPGGLLNQAIDLSNLFIKSGVIVSQKGRISDENITYNATGKAPYSKLPIVVLVNGGTASASEIVSGALQDHHRAIIMGEETFGKGSVQVVIPINATEAIKLTTAKYYLPSGRTIQAVGIKPDIIVHPGSVPQHEGGFEIKEADLRNHLQNELQKLDVTANDTAKHDDSNDKKHITHADIASDIQLKSAIDTLKVLAIMDASQAKNTAKK